MGKSDVVVPSTGPSALTILDQLPPAEPPDIVLEQNTQLNLLIPMLKKSLDRADGGVSVNVIGPIYVGQPPTKQPSQPQENRYGSQNDMQGFRNVEHGPEVSKEIIKRANALFKKLPDSKMDCLLRMFFEYAWSDSTSPSVVAKLAGCSPYQAKWFAKKFGIVGTD